jgi:uncharacterized protein YcfL
MRSLCALSIAAVALVGCAGEKQSGDLHKADQAVVEAALNYQHCLDINRHLAEQCTAEHKAYEDKLTSFKTKFGK